MPILRSLLGEAHMNRSARFVYILVALSATIAAVAADWPEILGAGRRAEWTETGILRQFPATGPLYRWRTPLGQGYAGPAVASGRVFVPDYVPAPGGGGSERVLCLDEQTGQVLWTYANPAATYNKFAYNSGPRAVPTVDGDRVYVMGAAGDLYALQAADGKLLWKVNLPVDFGAKMPTWGFAGSPVVYQDVLITPCGANNARLLGLDKRTGQELWRALPATSDLGYTSPLLINAGGAEQLIMWVGGEVASVNPQTGQVYWQQPITKGMPCATPTTDGQRLLLTDFFKGSALLTLAPGKPAAQVAWIKGGANEVNTLGLHGLMCSPLLAGDYLYGVCSYGQLRCLEVKTGERVWESLEATKENKRWATAFLVRNGEVYFLLNDRGELIIADLQPTGYKELARASILPPTSGGAGDRELKAVLWTLPAYANRHFFARNDKEIVRVSLER